MQFNFFDSLNLYEKYKLSTEDRIVIEEKMLNKNLFRMKIIYPILLLINLILLITDLIYFKKYWNIELGYRNLFYSHIVVILGLMFFIYFLYKKDINSNAIVYCSLLFILIWCVFLSINAQLIHRQISAYIIGILFAGTALLAKPINSLLIFMFSHLVFIIGIFLFNNNYQELSGNIVNSTYFLILTLVISYLNYSKFIRDYLKDKIIAEKTLQLKSANDNLKDILEKKTLDLKHANRKLVEEISKRHQLELKAIEEAYKYEKEKRILNEKLEYEELKTEFFANISHEFKTPLNLIFSSQQMIKYLMNNEYIIDKSDKLDNYIDIIKNNSYRLIRLINNLIDLTRLDVGSYKLELSNNDIVKAIEDITLSVAKFVKDKNINIIFDTEIEEKIIAFDLNKLERIILNLLSNAVKFSNENENIYVSLYEKNDNICISVKDYGKGIPLDMQDFIFERFIQVDKSIKRENEGSGIGLSLVKSLVEMHSGKIKVKSKPEKGSEFIIELPNRTVKQNGLIDEVAITSEDIIEKIQIEFSDIYF